MIHGMKMMLCGFFKYFQSGFVSNT